jgi:hypothetical protein
VKTTKKLRAGDWVEVRSKEEILKTLNERGHLESMPFMPEMLRFCGKRFQVSKRAHKTCDPVNGMKARGMKNAVHLLGLRCDGSAHDGCQAGCLIYWKDAWLKQPGESDRVKTHEALSSDARCNEEHLFANTKIQPEPADGVTYLCQATKVWDATYPLRPWDIRHYIEDFTSGNTKVSQMAGAFIFTLYHGLAEAGLGFGSVMRWLYDQVQKIRGGPPYPLRPGRVRKGEKTPTAKLDLQPGEMVRVKSYPEILETLDDEWKNRGLYFDAEMVPFCNGTFRVVRRVAKIIHEKTGKMLLFKNPAVILEGVECQARYAKFRKFCPRAYYQYCREVWLERTQPASAPSESLK